MPLHSLINQFKSSTRNPRGSGAIGLAVVIGAVLFVAGSGALLQSGYNERQLVVANKGNVLEGINKNAVVIVDKAIKSGVLSSSSGQWTANPSPIISGSNNQFNLNQCNPQKSVPNAEGSFEPLSTCEKIQT